MSNPLCICGHRHDDHGPKTSVNYTAGKCKCCECRNFLMAKEQPRDAEAHTLMDNGFYWFLKRMGYDKDKLSVEYLKALEEAFYAGASNTVLLVVGHGDEDKIKPTLETLVVELQGYWKIENIKDILNID